tara:strand:+ start:234 stop:509 length:276 start_codon:yes stop_codon:yes gene_type:complete
MSKNNNKEIEQCTLHSVMQSKFTDFVNEVMCRRDSNQRKADKLWVEIKPYIKDKDANLFETEWRGHYISTGEHTPDDFAYWIETLIKPYFA